MKYAIASFSVLYESNVSCDLKMHVAMYGETDDELSTLNVILELSSKTEMLLIVPKFENRQQI